ncbi:MAG: DNA polymerase III subunit gamma/tau [Limnoraphis robusta]
MTYEPLHHKYRPQTFADLVGQDAIATTLTNAICSQRIVPAYLFTGPRGTGKTSSARILAKSLNCLSADQPTAKPCGTCAVCKGITNGSTLDVIEIDAASNTGVDNIRELIERAQFAPVQCRYKVYVIDECHMLSTAAFNALLKTLEEPPERVVFVLATTDPQRVLPTIISRCQRFDFRRIPLEPMVLHLEKIAHQENIPITLDAVKMVSQIAQGGLRDAESLLDQLSLLSGKIDVEQVWDLVGAVPERDLMELLKAISSENTTDIIDLIRQLLNRGREPLIVLQNLAEFYRDLLIAKTAPQRFDLVKLTQPTWEELCQFSHRWELSKILAAQKYLRDSETQIKNTTQPRLWLEIILLGLLPSALTHSVLSVESIQTPTLPQTTASPKPFVAPSAPPLPTPTPPSQPLEKPVVEPSQTVVNEPIQVSPSANREESNRSEIETPTLSSNTEEYNLEDVWRRVLEEVKPPGTQALLNQHGRLLGMDTNVAYIGVPTQALYKMAQGKIPHMEAAFQRVFKIPVKVRLEVGTEKKKNSSSSKALSPEKNEHQPTAFPEPAVSPSPEKNPPTDEQLAETSSEELSLEPSPVEPQFETPSSPVEQSPKPLETHSINLPETSHQETKNDQNLEQDRAAVASQQLADFFAGEVINLREAKDFTAAKNVSVFTEEISTFEPDDIEQEEDQTDDDNLPF